MSDDELTAQLASFSDEEPLLADIGTFSRPPGNRNCHHFISNLLTSCLVMVPNPPDLRQLVAETHEVLVVTGNNAPKLVRQGKKRQDTDETAKMQAYRIRPVWTIRFLLAHHYLRQDRSSWQSSLARCRETWRLVPACRP